jgi:glycosyltransferase involved in cell wall biosynthesis
MKIAIIARTLKAFPNDGISRFTYEVVTRLLKNHPSHHFILIFDKKPDPGLQFQQNSEIHIIKPAARHPFLWFLWHECQLPSVLRKSGAELVLYPDGIMSLRSEIPALTVIHDISFYHRPHDTPLLTNVYYRYFFRKFAHRAVRICTVSEFCRDDISSYLKIDKSNIDVAYNGVSGYFRPLEKHEVESFRNKITGGNEYFLFVSNFSPRKNIPALINAYNKFREITGLDYKLVLTGGRLFLNSETDRLIRSSSWREDIITPGPVGHENLRFFYSAALALVFVPWFEGFGIPAAEAMSCGTPVILSSTTSLPEIGGEAALYADPGDTDEICNAMVEISRDIKLRHSLSEKGQSQSGRFTWEKTASDIWESIVKAAEI